MTKNGQEMAMQWIKETELKHQYKQTAAHLHKEEHDAEVGYSG